TLLTHEKLKTLMILKPSALKPSALQSGDTVALVCPSSRPFDPGKIAQSQQWLESEGYRVLVGRNILQRYGNFAGTDDQRLADFHEAWANPVVKALICERGGNGASRLLPRLDYDLIRANPKILIGYSDITALHLAIHKMTGLITFHGPVAMDARSTRYSYEQFTRALTSREPLGAIPDPVPDKLFPPVYPPYRMVIRAGRASGRLIGGNLTLIMETMGTPYEIDTAGKILFVEDVNEEPHFYDAYLTQLRQAGKLHAAAGIIVGQCAGSEPHSTLVSNFSLEDLIEQHMGDLGIPVVYGLRLGHTPDQCVLPIGALASLDASADGVQIIVEEAACR
ncbi:MAG: LD-carboxypeptidase, partial [Chloroflexota bacterium]